MGVFDRILNAVVDTGWRCPLCVTRPGVFNTIDYTSDWYEGASGTFTCENCRKHRKSEIAAHNEVYAGRKGARNKQQ